MKNIFKKLHKGCNQQPNRPNDIGSSLQSSSSPSPSCTSDHSTIPVQGSGMFPVMQSPPSYVTVPAAGAVGNSSSTTGNQQDYFTLEEEFQYQLALAISASNSQFRDDPEKDQIRAATLLSLGGRRMDSTRDKAEAAEALSRQYWEYSVLDYEEKVADGFYDVYGQCNESSPQGKMPSLSEIEANPGCSGFEVVIVNPSIDRGLEELLQVARCVVLDCPVTEVSNLVQRLAEIVTGHMGGPVKDANVMLASWMEQSTELRTSMHTSVLPIGSINIGLSRHRALLFKVLADNIELPCRLVKGSHYTGVDDDAVNIIKWKDESEFLVDLMAAPGTLIPADILNGKETIINPYNPRITKIPSFIASNDPGYSFSKQLDSSGEGSSTSSIRTSNLSLNRRPHPTSLESPSSQLGSGCKSGISSSNMANGVVQLDVLSSTGTALYKSDNGVHANGDATRLNLHVGQCGQNSLDDSRNLFSELNPFKIKGTGKTPSQTRTTAITVAENNTTNHFVSSQPPMPPMWKRRYAYNEVPKTQEYDYKDCIFSKINRELNGYSQPSLTSSSYTSTLPRKLDPDGYKKSYMINTTPKPSNATYPVEGSDVSEFNGKENLNVDCKGGIAMTGDMNSEIKCEGDTNCTYDRFMDTNLKLKNPESPSPSIDTITTRADQVLDEVDVGDCEIPWEDLVIGERIGLGSYGEVFHADWNGTEVAVKKFLDQDFSGAALAEFKREVRIMRRLCHPNVVLFMGAVTRPPNLSIISEFLPRGSLFRILHRPQFLIDERRRIKMALDVARGMNCLHTSIPTIVHRDLKSPNLLVDNNWNVKVCDFGLSRLKHNTFLSSKSTAGTPEWMAPEVLRNEPSNEKCDVYSFGVILWELATLRLPWSGMNPMQVVGAVGFQHRRLDIPKEVDPVVARIIWECLQTDPNLRPSFAQLTVALKSLQRLVIPANQDQRV